MGTFNRQKKNDLKMENLLVPRNLGGRKEKRKQMNIRFLSQEVINGNLVLDESFMDIDPKFVKIKKVHGNVYLIGGEWIEIPAWLKNVEITGIFDCSINKLISLKNCPQNIGADFRCVNNQLTSLEGCPENIKGGFKCSSNKLTSLEGCPKTIGGDFLFFFNKVELELPDYVKVKGRLYD